VKKLGRRERRKQQSDAGCANSKIFAGKTKFAHGRVFSSSTRFML
jgi:hypothetical protein